jgi:NAD(P)-dependent dehydrogenase (short-subunit alcohol dehydrogenase family)
MLRKRKGEKTPMANIVIIGASGTIGQAIADRLEKTNTLIRVGHHQGDHTVDLGSKASIEALYERIGSCDAVICAAGLSRFASLEEASDEDFTISIGHKLMGQVNLVRIARRHVAPGGSITITTGLLARDPMPGTAPTALVNAGLEGFVRAAALDLAGKIRINAVSPIFVTSTAERMGMPAAGTMTAAETAKAYEAAINGDMTGQVLDVRDFGTVE